AVWPVATPARAVRRAVSPRRRRRPHRGAGRRRRDGARGIEVRRRAEGPGVRIVSRGRLRQPRARFGRRRRSELREPAPGRRRRGRRRLGSGELMESRRTLVYVAPISGAPPAGAARTADSEHDRALVAAAAKGDAAAFRELYRRYLPIVHARLTLMVGPGAE